MRYAVSRVDSPLRGSLTELAAEPADEKTPMSGFVRVRNWEKFQHYKDRNPPWIKLHTELLDNYEFASLQDASKLLAMCTWLLAARSNNKIPCDPAWIQSRCNLKSLPDLEPLLASGFLEEIIELADCKQVASEPLAERVQPAIPRALARGEAEERQRQIPVGAQTPAVPDPRKQLFDLGKTILGAASGGLISKAIASAGEGPVGAILGEMALRPTADPKAYFVAAMRNKGEGSRFKTA
jgi:hypothetical protein